MSAQENPPGRLLDLAAEGILPVVNGCASAPAGEKAINRFGGPIVQRWCAWLNAQPVGAREAAFAELAALPPDEARRRAAVIVAHLAPDARPEDRSLAAAYLAALPLALDHALPATAPNGLPPTVTIDQPHDLLPLLPSDLPPYLAPCDLPGTPYRLDKLLGSGGFGAVYRATAPSLQHLPFAIKFCLDPAMTAALNQERSLLERLLKAGSEPGSNRVVRLYGYHLEHKTPFLVYEYVAGGDLLRYLARRRLERGRPLNANEVLGLVTQMVEALAFAHGQGLVHRDLKPANVLVDGDVLKLADFGLGGVAAARALRASRIGATAVSLLSMAERASLFRGAGTPLYVAPEQRRGDAPDPRHDLYSLGVVWFQLLSGDVTRELHPGWAKELLAKYAAPPGHVALIERCVGWIEERPKDAGELLPLARALPSEGPPVALPASFHGRPTEPIPAAVHLGPPPGAVGTQSQPAASTPSGEGEVLRRVVLESLVQQLAQAQKRTARLERFGIVRALVPSLVLGILVGAITYLVNRPSGARPDQAIPFPDASAGKLPFNEVFGQMKGFLSPFVQSQEAQWAETKEKEAIKLGVILSVGTGLSCAVLLFVLRRIRLRLTRQAVEAHVSELARDFPDRVRAWGGPAVLRNPSALREVQRALGANRP